MHAHGTRFFPICIGNINTAGCYVISTLPSAILNLRCGYVHISEELNNGERVGVLRVFSLAVVRAATFPDAVAIAADRVIAASEE